MIRYEVRFKGYRYNTGSSDNGIYNCIESVKDIDSAKKFIKFIKQMITLYDGPPYREDADKILRDSLVETALEINRDFLYDFYGIDYVTELTGLFEITEKEISTDE